MKSEQTILRCVLVVFAGIFSAGAATAKQRTILRPADAAPPMLAGSPGASQAILLGGGDSPLTPLESFSGHVDVFVDIIPFAFASDTSGTFTVAGLPAGASILRAWLQVTSFDTSPAQAVTATFDGNGLGTKLADVVDEGPAVLFCSLYRFEVTPFVPGNGSYPYGATGHSNAFGDALIVVYEHPSLPIRTIAINDGAEALAFGTTTTMFAGMPASTGNLILFTEADDDSSPEEVRLNGVTVAGPADVFGANDGEFASLVTIPVSSVAGTNTLDVITLTDYFGLHLAILRVEGGVEALAQLDIKPGSCPNSFNRDSNGVLPVALIGSDDFDVGSVDLSSIALSRADGMGGSISPHEGPSGPHSTFADAATPFDGVPCDCHELDGDGTPDLVLHFRSENVTLALELDQLTDGALVELVLSGNLADGTPFSANDCIRLVPPGTSLGLVSVQSNAAGTWIDALPLDETLDAGGFVDFERTYPLATAVTLTAPRFVGDRRFVRWVTNGVPQHDGQVTLELVVNGADTATAIYENRLRRR